MTSLEKLKTSICLQRTVKKFDCDVNPKTEKMLFGRLQDLCDSTESGERSVEKKNALDKEEKCIKAKCGCCYE